MKNSFYGNSRICNELQASKCNNLGLIPRTISYLMGKKFLNGEDGKDNAVAHLQPEKQRIIGNLAALEYKEAHHAMVPRADIAALSVDMTIEQIVNKFLESGFSRLPIYRESLDDIFGMVHMKDLMRFWGDSGAHNIEEVVREVIFVPPNIAILDLLIRIQSNGIHLVLVVDEYGGVDGLLTIEDLVEAIVGEIEDVRDRTTTPEVSVQPDGSLIVDARLEVADLKNYTNIGLMSDDVDEDINTIGGVLLDLAGRVPVRGEEIIHPSGLRMIVLSADPRCIHSIRILMPSDELVE